MTDFLRLEAEALSIRRIFLKMHYEARAGHIGSGLSCIDLLTYLHWMALSEEDRFILSKGHAASALYATLYHRGSLDPDVFATYYKDGTLLPAHPAPRALEQIPVATGSLGHGLPIGAGMAYAAARLGVSSIGRIFVLMSDGECNEGTTWEAALFASHHGLANLTVIVDVNGLQGFGRSREVLDLEPLADKWRALGFAVHDVSGHAFEEIHRAVTAESKKPKCILARTVKGKGVSFMEDRLEWHYLPMSVEQYEESLKELDQAGDKR